MNSRLNFERQLALGVEIELLCADNLRQGKRLVTEPDICIYDSKLDIHFFVECKRKESWVRWNRGLETGFDQVGYQRLMRLRESSGLAVWLVFYHENDPPLGWYCLALGSCEPRLWDGKTPSGKPVRDKNGEAQKPLALWTIDELKKKENWKLL